MSEDSMLMCLIAFVLGYLVGRMMRGNGLRVGGQDEDKDCPVKCLKVVDKKIKENNIALNE